MLDATDLTKTYDTADGPLTVLDHVSLSVSRGESVALTGESGSGKSTLLHCLGCLDSPDSGEIVLDGQAAARPRRKRPCRGAASPDRRCLPEP